MALPANSVFEAILEDVSKADAKAHVLGRTRIEPPGNPPIAFEIHYDPARIVPNHRYAVRARILEGTKVLFASDRQYPVLSNGQDSHVEILLRHAGAGPSAGSPTGHLENTHWKLKSIGGASVTTASPQQEPYLILNSKTSRVEGMSGCNRLTGSYKLDGDKLTFGQMAGTMMACPQGMDTEQQFLQALSQVAKWKVTGDTLSLLDNAGTTLGTLEARPAI
jgi:putative lipoprotein